MAFDYQGYLDSIEPTEEGVREALAFITAEDSPFAFGGSTGGAVPRLLARGAETYLSGEPDEGDVARAYELLAQGTIKGKPTRYKWDNYFQGVQEETRNITEQLNDEIAWLSNRFDLAGRTPEEIQAFVDRNQDNDKVQSVINTIQGLGNQLSIIGEEELAATATSTYDNWQRMLTGDLDPSQESVAGGGVVRTDSGFITEGEAATDAENALLPTAGGEGQQVEGPGVGDPREGQSTTVQQQDDGSYAIVGVDGQVLHEGYSSLQEALAFQVQIQSGGTPTLTGSPDVLAIDPTDEAGVEAVEAGDARVATEDELLTGQAAPSGPYQVSNVMELEQLAGYGLTEADLQRQGSAIYLQPGMTPQGIQDRGAASGFTGGQAQPGGTPQIPGGGGATTAQMQQVAQPRLDALATVTGDMSVAEQEAQLMGTIGQGIVDQEKALRELPDMVQERTQNVGVTQGQLNRLVATERQPIAQALKDLLTSRSLLQEQIAFRRDEQVFQQQFQDAQFEKMLQANVADEGTFAQFDATQGLPEGTHMSLFQADQAADAQAAYAFQIEAAGNLTDLLQDIPVGQSITIAGTTYQGLDTGNITTGTEQDSSGNVTLWEYDRLTGQTNTMSLGNIGEASGWEMQQSDQGVWVSMNPNTNQMRVMYDPNNPNGGIPNGGYINEFPQGSVSTFTRPDGSARSECGEWVNDLTGLGLANSFDDKMARMDSGINASNAQVGDVFVSPYDWTGHTGIINAITTGPDGRQMFTVSESNFSKNEDGVGMITHNRQISADQIAGFARPGFKDSSYSFGSDSSNMDGLTFTSAADVKPPTQAQSAAGGFGSRMEQAEQALSALESQFSQVGSQPDWMPLWLRSSDRQVFDQSVDNFITANLRKESGAAIADSEYETAYRVYIPQAGNSPEVIERKRATRELAIRNMVAEAGSAYQAPPYVSSLQFEFPQYAEQIRLFSSQDYDEATIRAALSQL